jgi:hypothetical protein
VDHSTAKTYRALRAACKSKNLATPGGCAYVYTKEDGTVHRCIVGTVLHNYGVKDDVLLGEYHPRDNSAGLNSREDLASIAKAKGLDVDLLRDAQGVFDGWDGPVTSPPIRARPFTQKTFLDRVREYHGGE